MLTWNDIESIVIVAQEEEDVSPNQVLHQVKKGKATFFVETTCTCISILDTKVNQIFDKTNILKFIISDSYEHYKSRNSHFLNDARCDCTVMNWVLWFQFRSYCHFYLHERLNVLNVN